MGTNKVRVNENIQFFLDDVNKPVAVVGFNGIVYQANERFKSIFGIDQQSNMEEVITSQSLAMWKNALHQISTKKKATFDMQFLLNLNRKYKVKVSLIFDESDEVVIVLFNMPLSYKRDKEMHWESAFRKSDNLLIVSNEDGYIKEINDLVYEYFAIPRDRLIGRKIDHVFELFSGETLDANKFKQKVIEEGYAETLQQYIHPSEHIRYYKVTSFNDSHSNLILTKIKDQTEKALLKQQLAHEGSLLEVGQLAASIAHEIRNPITTLKGFTQLLKANANEETLKYLNVIDDEIQRMESILSEMLFLSKPTTFEKEIISLNSLLLDIIQVIYPKATLESILIVQQKSSVGETLIFGEEGKLKQVFLNLMKNALESMQPGGTLSIGLENGQKNHVDLIIQDTGKGMDETQVKQIFLPYFTTRPDGTGLGLPFVLKTIEEHGGSVSVSSEVGKGTKFILSFPVVEKKMMIEKDVVHIK